MAACSTRWLTLSAPSPLQRPDAAGAVILYLFTGGILYRLARQAPMRWDLVLERGVRPPIKRKREAQFPIGEQDREQRRAICEPSAGVAIA